MKFYSFYRVYIVENDIMVKFVSNIDSFNEMNIKTGKINKGSKIIQYDDYEDEFFVYYTSNIKYRNTHIKINKSDMIHLKYLNEFGSIDLEQ